jgi:hypothetical protein
LNSCRSCCSVAEAEAGPHASASQAAAAAAAAGGSPPHSMSFDTRFGNAADELEESKTMSLSNLKQLLMGSFCSTTDCVDLTVTVKKPYKSVEA